MKAARADLIFGCFVSLLAVAYLAACRLVPVPQIVDPVGPRVFPMIIGVGLLAGGIALCIKAAAQRVAVPIVADAAPNAFRHWRPLLAVLVWTVAYYLCFVPVGYLLTTSVYVFGLLCVFNRRHHVANLVIAVGFSLTIYLVFARLLNVDLPRGLLSV